MMVVKIDLGVPDLRNMGRQRGASSDRVEFQGVKHKRHDAAPSTALAPTSVPRTIIVESDN